MRLPGHGGVGGSWKTAADDQYQHHPYHHHHHQEPQHSPQDSRQSSGGEESIYSDNTKDEDMTAHFCRVCDQSFTSAHAMEAHVRQNHCDVLMDGSSVSGDGRDQHQRINMGAFPCSRCPKVFEIGASLEQHLATHHASRSFQVCTIHSDNYVDFKKLKLLSIIVISLCVSSANNAARHLSVRRRCRLTCSSTLTPGRILASTAAKGFTRNQT
jgi:hypothetical protein